MINLKPVQIWRHINLKQAILKNQFYLSINLKSISYLYSFGFNCFCIFSNMLFKQVIGQQAVKQKLIQTIKDGRISHARLFLGSEGSGALALAIAYAQCICCTNKQSDDSCGSCASCIKYAKLIHPDLHFAYPITSAKEGEVSTKYLPEWREQLLQNPYMNLFHWISEIGKENQQGVISKFESEEIMRKLLLTSYESDFKVLIIWMAEKMNPAAANKLLKILEEPPEKTLFILVSENEDQLLATITSRTQLTRIKKLEHKEISDALISHRSLAPEEAGRIAFIADGNYNEALKIADNETGERNNFELFRNWMRMCLKFDSQKVVKMADELSGLGRENQKNFLLYSLNLVRACLMYNYGKTGLVKLQGEELDFVQKFSPFVNGNNCERFSEELNKAYHHIERNASSKILFLDLSFVMNEILNVPAGVVSK